MRALGELYVVTCVIIVVTTVPFSGTALVPLFFAFKVELSNIIFFAGRFPLSVKFAALSVFAGTFASLFEFFVFMFLLLV